MIIKSVRRLSWLLLMALGASVPFGCTPSSPIAVPPGPEEAYTIAVDSPSSAARSALLIMRAELKALARSDRAAAGTHLKTLRDQVIAIDAVTAEIRKMPHVVRARLNDAEIAELVEQLTGSWSAIVSHYADGFDLERLVALGGEGPVTTVLAPAHGRDGDAIVRLRCVRMADGSWRVSRVDFVPRPSAASQPTTAATSPG